MNQKRNRSKTRWLIFSISGLLATGAGLFLFGEALWYKFNNYNFWIWFAWGTAALVVFNAGLCLFGQGVIERMKYLKRQKAKQ